MQPENQQPDYNFILNPKQPNNKGFLTGAGKGKRILIVAAGGFLLLLLSLVVYSVLFGGGSDKQQALRLAQQHTELIRVSELGEEKARSQATKNLATTTRLTLQSTDPEITAIASNGKKLDKKLLGGGQKASTDKTLTEAEQRGQFDEVFTELLGEELKAYRSELQRAFNASSSAKNKQLYSSLYAQLGNIITTAGGTSN